MLFDLVKRLTSAPTSAPLTPEDCRLALTTLMLRVAKADGHYDEGEKGAIEAILTRRYGLDTEGKTSLLAEAEELEAQANDNVRFTKLIKDAVPYEERAEVVEALWEVALADGRRSDDENGLLRLVVSLIGVNDRDSALARQRVERKLS